MPNLCTRTDVLDLLPENPGVTNTEIDDLLPRGENYVNTKLGKLYWPMPGVADDPATPETPRRMATRYVAELCLGKGGFEEDVDVGPQIAQWRAENERDRIALAGDDTVDPTEELPPVQISPEALTFGSDADHTDWAFLAHYLVQVTREATEISGYEYGTDFVVDFSKKHRRWYVHRLNSAIVTDDTVSYWISYLKEREQPEARPGGSSVELQWAG